MEEVIHDKLKMHKRTQKAAQREERAWAAVEVEMTWTCIKNNKTILPKQRHAYIQPVVISEFTAGHVQISVFMNKPKHPPTTHLCYSNQIVLVNKHIIACFLCVINSLWACICCMWAAAAQEVRRSSSNQKVVIRSPAPAVCRRLSSLCVCVCVCDLCCSV